MRLLPLATLAAALLAAAPAQAATWTVTKTADTADGACDADCSLREAVLAANAAPGSDTVTVPAGTYRLTIAGRDEDAGATGDLDLAGPGTTITGAGEAATVVEAGPSRAAGIDRVLHVAAANTLVQDLTLRHGRLQSNTQENGGAVRVDRFGGLEMRRAAVRDSDAGTGSLHGGGGISAVGTLRLSDVTVDGNLAGGLGGGGILLASDDEQTALLQRVTVSRNVAADANVRGGGILSQGRHVLTMTNATVSANELTPQSTGSGGGRGAGIAIVGLRAATLRFVTIAGNQGAAPGAGTGGLWASSADTTTVGASILAGNTHNGSESNCTQTATLTSAGGNVADDATCAWLLTQPADLGDGEPGLGPLQANGGPTETHGLLAGSAAIDRAGATCAFAPTDQRGLSRPQGDGCDAGAYEVGPVPEPDLAVTLTDAPDPAAVGEAITYTARIVNVGGTDAQAVELTWSLPSGDELVTDVGTVLAGAAARVSTHRFTPAGPGQKIATVTVAAAGDPVAANDTAQTTTTVTTVAVPANTAPPAISPPAPAVGTQLTCSPGAWSNAPTSFAYSWRRGSTVVGTGPSYTPPLGDANRDLACRVVATNAGGDGLPADSAPVRVSPPPVAVNTVPPSISPAAAVVGTVLTCDPGAWTGAPDAFDYWWSRGDALVGTGPQYTVVAADAGMKLFCRVVAVNDGGESAAADTEGVNVPPLPPPPVRAEGPDLAVALEAGESSVFGGLIQYATITVTNAGTERSAPGSLRLTVAPNVRVRTSQLPAGCTGPSGGPVDCALPALGKQQPFTKTIQVGASESGDYAFGAVTSSPGDVDGANDGVTVGAYLSRMPGLGAPPANSPPPGPSSEGERPTSIAPGSAEPGTELSCVPNNRMSGPITYEWQRNGSAIAGQNGPTYEVARADVLQRISCVAVGSRTVELGLISTTVQFAQTSGAVVPTAAMAPALVFSPAPLQATGGGSAPVDTYCPQSAGGCAGTIQVMLGVAPQNAVPSRTATAAAAVRSPERLGAARFKVRGGRNNAVSVKLTPFARRLLKASRSLPVRIVVRSRAKKAGRRRTASAKTFLRAPVRRR